MSVLSTLLATIWLKVNYFIWLLSTIRPMKACTPTFTMFSKEIAEKLALRNLTYFWYLSMFLTDCLYYFIDCSLKTFTTKLRNYSHLTEENKNTQNVETKKKATSSRNLSFWINKNHLTSWLPENSQIESICIFMI